MALLRSVTETDDSPMQVEIIDGSAVTHFTLKNLDRDSHYRFYLRGRTEAGDGVPIMMKGATTLDGGIKPIRSFDTKLECFKSYM